MATMYLSIGRFQITSSWTATYLKEPSADGTHDGELKYSYPTEKQVIKVFNASAIPAGSVIQQAILTVSAAEGKGGGYLRINGSTALSQDVTALFQASQEGKYADFGMTFSYRAYGNSGTFGSHTSTAVIRSATIAVTYIAGNGEEFDPNAYRNAALASVRAIHPRGIVTYPDGSTQPIDNRNIVRFEINEGYDNGILLGAAAGAVLEMELANAGGEWLPGGSMRGDRPIYGAKITMEIGLKVNGDFVYTPAGTYIIDTVKAMEGDPVIKFQGFDEMCNALEKPFKDELRYPATLSQILQEIITQSGMGVFGVLACNRVAQIPKTPDWGEECTIRKALSFVCAAGGSYAYITRDGMVGIADAWKQTPALELGVGNYMRLVQDERVFTFNRITVKPRNAKKESENISAAVNADIEELPDNTLYIDDNPLFVKGQAIATTMANALRDALQGASWQALDVRWRGDPSVTVGTRVKLTDRRGSVIHSSIMAQTMGWDNGFYSASRCKVDTKVMNKSAITGGGMIDTKKVAVESILGTYLVNGAITEEKLSDGSIKKAHIQQATIDELNTEAFTAVSAEIERLAAGEVTTDKLYAALATIASAQITAASIDKANIQWAEIASLSAKIAEIAKAQITTANIDKANIQWANIASLSASIAQIVTAKLKTADIDFAHIKDLAADTAIITKGVGGELYISRLAVTEANMVSLSVGQLLVKGQDGGFYALSVDGSGNITTEKKQVGNDDVGNLSINAGEKLIEGSVTAATLNAKDIFADSAIIRQLIAANIDVDTLFAREATVAKLNATDISGNEYLRLSVKKAVDDIEIGGRNLLKNSKGGFVVSPQDAAFASYPFSFVPTLGETYTFSADVEITDGNFDKISVYPYPSEYSMLTNVPIPANGRIVHTFTASYDTITNILAYAGVAGETHGNGVIFRNVKIEKGNKATDWTPAPEDIEERVSEAEAEIAVQAGEIALRVKVGDPVETLENSAMTLNGNGIEMSTTGHFRLYANDGKNSRIKLGGDDETANFSVDETGKLGAVSGAFANGLTVGGQGVWTRGNIIISSSQPTGVHDVLWLQPLQGVQQVSHNFKPENNTSMVHNQQYPFTLTPVSTDVLSNGGSYQYTLEIEVARADDGKGFKDYTFYATLSTSAGSVTLSSEKISMGSGGNARITMTANSATNLFATAGNAETKISVTAPDTGSTGLYIKRGLDIKLTSKNTAASSAGAQTCTIHYIQ